MKFSRIGRMLLALVVSLGLGLGLTSCAVGTIAYMWVLGTQYNQIAGFKVDDYTGNLTPTVNSPYSSGGTNPVSIVVRTGGRYVYVVNEGTATTGGNIAQFTVGGDGVLTFQQSFTSQGSTPIWAATDTTGNFLYVLDQLSPDGVNGDITVFQIDSNTGRLSLVTNTQVKNANGTYLSYFPVGPKPIMMRASGSCLFTLDAGDNTVFPYQQNTGTGQLTLTTNSTITTGSNTDGGPRKLTSINASGSYVYLTDAAATTTSTGGQILPYTVGTNCALNSLAGGAINNLPLTSNPSFSFTDSRSKFLYVLNQTSTNSQNPNSSISAFTIDPGNGKLQPVGGSTNTNNPYAVGSGPVCMVEDPTNQYLYTSNHADGTVTGKLINIATGELSDLARGSSFPAVGLSTCLAISGNTSN